MNMKTIKHRDTEAQRRTVTCFFLCLCVSVVKGLTYV